MAERVDRHRVAIATALFLAVLLVGAVTQFLPRLTPAGDVTSATPVRRDLTALYPVKLAPGARACVDQVTFDPAVRSAELTLIPDARGIAPSRLTLTASAPGYSARSTAVVARNQVELSIPLPPPRRGAIGTLCVRDSGRNAVTLAGTADWRALTRSAIVVHGEHAKDAFSLTLREAGDRSLLNRTAQLVDRTAALSAVGPWFVWLLIPLLLLGVPAAVMLALRLALREPDPAVPAAGPGTGAPSRPDRQ